MADLGFELLFRFLWGGVVLLTILNPRNKIEETPPRVLVWIFALGSLTAAVCALFSHLSLIQTLPALGALAIGAALQNLTRSKLIRAAGFALVISAPIFWLAGRGAGNAFNFAASSFLLGTVFAGVQLVPRRANAVISALGAALMLRALQVAMTLFLAIGFNARPNVDEMGRPIAIDISNTMTLPQLSTAVAMLPLEGSYPFGLGFLGWLILGTRLLWGLLGPWILVYLLIRATRIAHVKLTRRILYTLAVMLLLGEGAALFLQSALGWLV